jgi:pimeloyl-ACP methyl ester carboxylesterase
MRTSAGSMRNTQALTGGRGASGVAIRQRSIWAASAQMRSSSVVSPAKRRSTIFNRDHPAFGDPLVAEAWSDYELALDDSFPTGTYLDMSANLPLIDPAKIRCPVQIIRGEFDGIASDDDPR